MKGEDTTITEIYEYLRFRAHVQVSRKTIQRDMDELIEKRIVLQKEGCPLKFSLIEDKTCRIELNIQEIDELIEILFKKPLIQDRILAQINDDELYPF